jgi:hypothetical protein
LSTRNVLGGKQADLTTVCELFVSQPYEPPWPVTGIALPHSFTLPQKLTPPQKKIKILDIFEFYARGEQEKMVWSHWISFVSKICFY